MLILHAKVHVKPEKRAQFLQLVKPLIEASNQEEGVIAYSCNEDVTDPNTFLFYEEYIDQSAIDSHFQAKHFKNWRAAGSDLLSGRTPARIMTVSETKTLG
jgi:quinol monooxygenase YgiN